ncbi:MAG: hypothetical protein HC924_18605 [Synechococcaceae cyanobacterium SM2_3_2]|nr:hypothetical protein [Synechococcaceae cyanobacterium SM2_3_2]
MPVAQTSTSSAGSEVVTLYFDGNPNTFLLSDLAVALALFLDPDASVADIQSTALDIFGIALTEDEIIGAGPNPFALYDLNGDGQVGTIQDLGVAVAAFLGATTRAEAEQIGIDLGITLNIAPGFEIPGPNATPFPFPVRPTIIDLALETPDLSLLVEAVVRAGLVDTLNGFGPFTVFAPNNAAFTALLNETGFASIQDVPVPVLQEILLYHVVGGEFPAAQLTALGLEGQTLLTNRPVSGSGLETVTLSTIGSNLFINDSQVIAADIQATNGIVHVIDEVLDAVAPALDSTSPAEGGLINDLTPTVTLTFNEDVEIASGDITVNGGGTVDTVNAVGDTVTLTLTLPADGTYTITVSDGAVEDTNSNHFGGDTLTFTVDSTVPMFVTSPQDGAVGLPITSSLELEFDDDVFPGAGSFTLQRFLLPALDTRLIPVDDAQVVFDGNTVTINLDAALNPFPASYFLSFPAGIVVDAAGNPLDMPGQITFQTGL